MSRPACDPINFAWWHVCYSPQGSCTRVRSNPPRYIYSNKHFGTSLCANVSRRGKRQRTTFTGYSQQKTLFLLIHLSHGAAAASEWSLSWRPDASHRCQDQSPWAPALHVPLDTGITWEEAHTQWPPPPPPHSSSLHTPLGWLSAPLPGSGLRGWLTLPCVHLGLLVKKGHPGQPIWLCRSHSCSLPESVPRKLKKI